MREKKLFNRIFKLQRIGKSHKVHPYLYRWTLINFGKWGRVQLHKFVGDDWSRDAHDHSANFISIGLKGCYTEAQRLTSSKDGNTHWFVRRLESPFVRRLDAEYAHRVIAEKSGECWVLVIGFKERRESGYWLDDRWVHASEYENAGISRRAK